MVRRPCAGSPCRFPRFGLHAARSGGFSIGDAGVDVPFQKRNDVVPGEGGVKV
jgi:hypothetical protein